MIIHGQITGNAPSHTREAFGRSSVRQRHLRQQALGACQVMSVVPVVPKTGSEAAMCCVPRYLRYPARRREKACMVRPWTDSGATRPAFCQASPLNKQISYRHASSYIRVVVMDPSFQLLQPPLSLGVWPTSLRLARVYLVFSCVAAQDVHSLRVMMAFGRSSVSASQQESVAGVGGYVGSL